MSNPDLRTSKRKAAPNQIGSRGWAQEDPRLDRILLTLETMVGQQVQNQANAAAAATVTVIAPIDVPLVGNRIGD